MHSRRHFWKKYIIFFSWKLQIIDKKNRNISARIFIIWAIAGLIDDRHAMKTVLRIFTLWCFCIAIIYCYFFYEKICLNVQLRSAVLQKLVLLSFGINSNVRGARHPTSQIKTWNRDDKSESVWLVDEGALFEIARSVKWAYHLCLYSVAIM